MQVDLIAALDDRRPQIRKRWEAILRTDRACSPLADPDALVHLIDWTLSEFQRTLRGLPTRRRPLRPLSRTDLDCSCGQNPLLVYFAAGEQALQESLVLAQAARCGLTTMQRDAELHELNLALHHIAGREIGSFCALCQLRGRGSPPEPMLAAAAK
ncbi:MAG: hypothetical protein RIR76_3185 [Verrucomicrobiota bacterium]|nr:hypothetical protein [Opitutaceae bacterium]